MLNCTKNKIFFLIALTALTSCLSRVDKHGYNFDLSDHDQLQAGISTKERVLRLMGSPTIVSDLDDDETWIYYAEDVNKLLFFKPDAVNRTVLAIKFDQEQNVRELQNYDLSHETNLSFASNYTEVKSNKTGFFKSIFSNIGQVRPQ